MKYYIKQFGATWSLSKAEFISVLQAGAKGEYSLESFKRVKKAPANSFNVFTIINWSSDDFKEQIEVI
jgi:hypothetical protein